MSQFRTVVFTLIFWLGIIFKVEITLAQETEVKHKSETLPQLITADSEKTLETYTIRPTGGVRLDSSGGGYDGVGQINTFLPLWQNPGSNLLYFDGRLLLDNGTNIGTNLILGYRFASPNQNRLWGFYAGYDLRNTDSSTFHQVGLGIESKGTIDFLLNGYIPVGETRNHIGSGFGGEQITSSNFSGNFLMLSINQEERRFFESALGGVDLEIGGKLLAFGNGGDLRVYGKTYYLNGQGVDGTIGGGARIALSPTENLTMGLGFQSDGVLGTNLNLSIGYVFPKSSQPRESSESANILARMGERVERTPTIRVDHQEEVQTNSSTAVAINPNTGTPWNFIHVSGGSSGDGTFENPKGQVTDAVTMAATAGNDIVYVKPGTGLGFNGFTIPDNVQVLSDGVTQSINTQLGTIQIPGSGTGTLSVINGATVMVDSITAMVSMGNDSTLSGFEITTTGNNRIGVVAANVSGTTIDRNRIKTGGEDAHGIFTRAYGRTDDVTIENATISGNTIETSGEDAYGVFVYVTTTPPATVSSTFGTATISGNTISTTGETGKGIYVKGNNNSTIETVTIADNTISTSGDVNAFGVQVNVSTIPLNTATISGNRVTTSGNNASAIYIRAQNTNGRISNATISGNTVLTSGNYSDGIIVRAAGTDAMISTATVSDNTISTGGSYADGLAILTNNNTSTLDKVTVTGNIIQQAGAHSAIVEARNASESICIAQFTGNTSGMPNVFAGGGNDLNFNPSAGTPGTINFVGFADIAANNTGFNDIVITNGTVSEAASCP